MIIQIIDPELTESMEDGIQFVDLFNLYLINLALKSLSMDPDTFGSH